ncbi:MAG: hypothetical protein OXF54_02220 [Caldilineaceae bacterium]|nr:hypothetical protein [Caldilineaceae bacterium]
MTWHLDNFEAHLNSSLISPEAVYYDAENGVILFTSLWDGRLATETWRGCELLDFGEWVEEEKIVKRIPHCTEKLRTEATTCRFSSAALAAG